MAAGLRPGSGWICPFSAGSGSAHVVVPSEDDWFASPQL